MDHTTDTENDSPTSWASGPAAPSRRSLLRRAGAAGLAAGAAAILGGPLVSKAATRSRTAAADSSLTLWTFVDTHNRWFKQRAVEYQKQVNPNFSLTTSVRPYVAHHQKLLTVLQTGIGAPDLADVEQGQFGAFLHGTVPFAPLEGRLTSGHFLGSLVPSREALYTWQGHIYGVEHALCPVVLYYRADYFAQYGIKPTDLKTWDDFIAAGLKLQAHNIYMTPIPGWDVLLRQRGSDLFDAKGNLTADSPLSIATLQWCVDLAFKHKIAKAPAGLDATTAPFFTELSKGTYATVVGADWYAGFLEDNAAHLSGKWRAMPLPVWSDDRAKRQTSCAGGTGLCIPVTTSKQDLAWDFLRFCLLTSQGEVEQYSLVGLYPPFVPAWKDSALQAPVPYFGGQRVGALLAELGQAVPPQYQSPYRATFNNFTSVTTGDGANVLTGRQAPAAFLKYESARTRAQMK